VKTHSPSIPEPNCGIAQHGQRGLDRNHIERILGMVGDHVVETNEMVLKVLQEAEKQLLKKPEAQSE
jgi:hypothetical protein